MGEELRGDEEAAGLEKPPEFPGAPAEYVIRAGAPSDNAFIVSTWTQSYWKGSHWGSRVRWPQFGPRMRTICDGILRSNRARVLVACSPADPDEIYGYLVYQRHARTGMPGGRPCAGGLDIIHFCYVKPFARWRGVMNALIRMAGLPFKLYGVYLSCATRAWFSSPGKQGLEAKFPGVIHDPFLPMYYLSGNDPFKDEPEREEKGKKP